MTMTTTTTKTKQNNNNNNNNNNEIKDNLLAQFLCSGPCEQRVASERRAL
jgi:hypothetical protein